ncbi:MAG: hypothetical protein WAK03_07145 [Methylocystis sp.]|jgi:hypothetical protein
MSDRAHQKDGIATPLIAVIVGVLFALILFYKFVDWVGPYSGGLSSQEVGKGSVAGR